MNGPSRCPPESIAGKRCAHARPCTGTADCQCNLMLWGDQAILCTQDPSRPMHGPTAGMEACQHTAPYLIVTMLACTTCAQACQPDSHLGLLPMVMYLCCHWTFSSTALNFCWASSFSRSSCRGTSSSAVIWNSFSACSKRGPHQTVCWGALGLCRCPCSSSSMKGI